MPNKNSRGTSLAGAVCVISISLIAALTIASSASLNAGMLQQTENVQIASLLADSAIQQGVAELMKTPTWGSNVATHRISYAGPVDRSDVLLTFDKNAGVPYCTRNQTSGPLAQGWPGSKLLTGRNVPGERVHLVAVGRCRNVKRTREAIVHVPNYTISLGATGKVHLHSSTVGSLKSLTDLADPTAWGPGDLATNSAVTDSVLLEHSSRVIGNLQSCGDIALNTGSTVDGEVRSRYGGAELPHFDFAAYDPATTDTDDPQYGSPLQYQTFSTGMHSNENVVGLVRCPGSATVNGDLHLDNCMLYVVGDLVVTGGLRGTGAVIVNGSTRVEGGSTLTSDDNVALLSRGDISLLGNSGNSYNFQGLVYTRGNFTARFFTVIGGFVADGSVPGTGNVDLHGSKLFHSPVGNKVDLYVPYQQTLQFASLLNEPGQEDVPILGDGNKYHYGLSPVTIPLNAPDPTGYDTPVEGANYPNGGGGWDWWNPAMLQISREHVNGTEQYVYTLIFNDNGVQSHRFTDRAALIDYVDQLHQQKCPAYHDGINQGDNDTPYQAIGPGPPQYTHLAGLYPDYAGLVPETSPFLRRAWELRLPVWESRNKINAGGAPVNFSFDPNRFLQEHDKVRISAVCEY